MVPTAPPVQNQTARKQLLSVTKRTQDNENKQATAVETTRVKIKAVTKKKRVAARASYAGKMQTTHLLSGIPKGINLGGLKLAPKPYIIQDIETETIRRSRPEPEPEPELEPESDSDSDAEDHGVYQRWIAGAVRLISMDNKYIFDPTTSAHIGTVSEDDTIEWH